MTTPALVPAAMITLVAFGAAIERRHAAMAAWYGMALAISPLMLLAAPYFAGVAVARRLPIVTAAIFALPALGTALALRAFGLPHSDAAVTLTRPDVPLPAAIALITAAIVAIGSTLVVRRSRRRLA